MAQPIDAAIPGRQPQPTSTKLEDGAATAALYTSDNRENSVKDGREFLDSDNRLSSAGAAASLKYAQPRDLPSYPSSGLNKSASAAGAAASLGWANQKPFEHWKPDHSASASAAAVMAKDYKMAPSWQPEQSSNGARGAAVLAHRGSVSKAEIWTPEPSVASWGNSAAVQAMKKDRAGGLSPQLNYGHTTLGRRGSLLAATGAMSTGRKRAESSPIVRKLETYPDEANAVANALSAATISASRSQKRNSNIPSAGGSVPFTNMSREMYTSHPPVGPEVEEQNREAVLHASAVAMAKKMYNHQQLQIDAATAAAQKGAMAAHRRTSSGASSPDEAQPMRFNSLQEAAQKLAQERLGKLHDEHAKNREYRDYYGSNPMQSRLSIRGRTRKRASSDGKLDEDREQSNKIRAQMSLFSTNISQVDAKKRQQDREALIAAAQRNVTKSLHGMDEKVFADTGKVTPSLLSEWEMKAHAAAQANSNLRMENHGKVHIGGGKFIDQKDIDAVAARNVQPVLDEINEKAEAERERQAILKLDQETQQRKVVEEKTREKERKEIEKKLKQQEKEERKAREDEEKNTRKEEKRLEKEKRKSVKLESSAVPATEAAPEPVVETAASVTAAENEPTIAERRDHAAPPDIRTSMEDQASLRMQENADAANKNEVTPMSPSSNGSSKVKDWLKHKFNRRSSRAQKPSPEAKETSFVGGAALTGASVNDTPDQVVEAPVTPIEGESAGAQEVALASENQEPARERDSVVSALSSVEDTVENSAETTTENTAKNTAENAAESTTKNTTENTAGHTAGQEEDDNFQEARDNFDEDLAPPPTFAVQKSISPVRAGKFTEDI